MNRLCRILLFLSSICCLAAIGCNGPVYHNGPRFWADRISPRTRWRVLGDLRNPLNAVDGEISTAAVGDFAGDNATLTLDLGKPCLFNMVVVEHGLEEYGYCRRMAVLTSNEGVNFTRQMDVPGLRRVTTAVLIRPVLARYVRIQATVPGHRRWSVAEVHLY